MLRRVAVLAFVLAVFGTGCFEATPVTPPRLEQTEKPINRAQEEILAPGFERLTLRHGTGTNDILVLYRFETGRFHFGFRSATSPRMVSAWNASATNTVAVMNGAYFNEDFSPSGALVADGVRIGRAAFDTDKSAVLWLDSPTIQDTSMGARIPESGRHWAQSYPLLIRDGEPAVKEDSGKAARRAFAGLDEDGYFYLGIVPNNITLFALSNVLAGMNINWTSVLNMDGGPSSGLVSNLDPDSIDSWTEVPNVIVVTK